MSYEYGTDEWERAYLKVVEERTAAAPVPYVLGTPEWLMALERATQEDEKYKEAAMNWEGSVVIHILAEPAAGFDEDIYLFMDLWRGDCRSMRLVPAAAGQAADFVITGKYERWRAVIAKEIDTVRAMMQGKLKLTKGKMTTVVKQVKAPKRLVELVSVIGTRFPDEMSPEEFEAFRGEFSGLRAEFGF